MTILGITMNNETKKALLDTGAPSAALLKIARELLGGKEMEDWDPETIWVTLDRLYDIDLPLENRDKLLAALTLLDTHSFYWEANCFEKTIMAFNDIEADIGILQEPEPEHLCWGVTEAELILQSENQQLEQFNTEPQAYVATVLFRQSFVLAPEPLEFAQEALDAMLGENHGGAKKSEVESAWKRVLLSGWAMEKVAAEATPKTQIAVQVQKLAQCKTYVQERLSAYKSFLHQVGW